MIIDFYKRGNGGSGSGYTLPTATATRLGGIKVGDGLSVENDGTLSTQGGGSVDSGVVLNLVNSAITDFSQELQEGEPIVGMAKQLYSPDGVEVEGIFNIRTTGGDKDVDSGKAELRKVEGNSVYPELKYNDGASFEREGESYDLELVTEWGNKEPISVEDGQVISEYSAKTAIMENIQLSFMNQGYAHFITLSGLDVGIWYTDGAWTTNMNCTQVDENHFTFNGGTIECDDLNRVVAIITGSTVWNKLHKDYFASADYYVQEYIPNDIPMGNSTYTYDGSDWSPALPQAVSEINFEGVPYSPEADDVMTISRVPYRESRAIFPAPTNFVALGLNSFCASANTPISTIEKVDEEGTYELDDIYVRAVPQTEYTIYSREGLMPDSVGYGVIVDAGTWKGQSGIYKNISIAPVPDAVKSAIEETGNNYNSTVFAHILSYRAEGEDDAYVDLILHPDRDGNIEVWDTNEETYLHLYTDDEENWFAINIDGVESYVGLKWDAANRIISFCGADTEYAEPEDCYAIDFTMATPIYKAYMVDADYDGNITGEPYHITVPEGFTYIWMEQGFDAEEEEKEAQKAEIFGNLCVHPTWSGIKDEEYAEYTESKVPLTALMTICPLWSIGSGETAYRNIIDLENGQLIQKITTEPYSAERVLWYLSHSYTIGANFDFDSEYIYVAQDPVTTDVSVENYKYGANDFSIEYLEKGNKVDDGKAVVDTYYMANLVDKLRNLDGLVHLNTLSGATGKTSAIYECDNELFWWDENGGAVAEWTFVNPSNTTFEDSNGYGLIFSNIPDGQVLFEYSYRYNDNWRRITYEDGKLTLRSASNDYSVILSSCTVGELVQWQTEGVGYNVGVKFQKHYIGFMFNGTMKFQNKWNGNVEGGHFVLVNKNNHPFPNISDNYDAGIPKWNSKGEIVGKSTGTSSKTMYFNTTGSTNAITYITNGSNGGPQRIFAPSQSGTQGQVLTSAGNAEPTWSNWIKSVQITSAEYEALTTKDPNVLYLIVDE